MNKNIILLIFLSVAFSLIAANVTEKSSNSFTLDESDSAAFDLKEVHNFRQGMTIIETDSFLTFAPLFKVTGDSLKIDSSFELRTYKVKPEHYYNCYFVLYNNGKLVFWGFPSEFTKSNNELYRQYGAFALAKVENEKEKIAEEKQAEKDRKKKEKEEKKKARGDNGYY